MKLTAVYDGVTTSGDDYTLRLLESVGPAVSPLDFGLPKLVVTTDKGIFRFDLMPIMFGASGETIIINGQLRFTADEVVQFVYMDIEVPLMNYTKRMSIDFGNRIYRGSTLTVRF